MRRVSIRSILIGLFSLMLLMIAGQGLLAVYKISAVNDSVEDIGGNWLPSIDIVREMNTTLNQFRIAEAKHILSTDDTSMQGYERELDERAAQLAAQRKRYEPLISSPEERATYESFGSHWIEYQKVHKSMIEASRKNDNATAGTIFKVEGFKAFDKLNRDSVRLVDFNKAGAQTAINTAATNYSATRLVIFAMLAVGMIVAVGAAFFSFFGIARPIGRITGSMNVLAGGDTEAEIPFAGRQDEIGSMAAAVRVFRDNMIDNRRRAVEQKEAEERAAAEKLAAEERDLAMKREADERQQATTKDALHQLVKDFQAAVGGVVDTVAAAATELEASAGTLTKAADATQGRSNAVAAASEQASANVQSVASAAEQLAASVHEIGKQVNASSEIARQAVAQAEKTDVRVTELSQAASRIGDVVKLITAIAEQTNLLALNATIEAARAGESGRGFAVVAQEVKALASQTAKATGDIGTQITSMQTATQDSVKAIKEIGSTIGRISDIATAIALAVEEQGAATQEIARNVEQASRGTAEVSSNITEVSQHANETGAASTQMLGSAQSLAREGNHLKKEMEDFIHSIRTGLADRRKADDPAYAGPERRKGQASRVPTLLAS